MFNYKLENTSILDTEEKLLFRKNVRCMTNWYILYET